MSMKFSEPNDKFDIVEVEVFEEVEAMDATHMDAEAEIVLPRSSENETTTTQTRRRRRERPAERKFRKNKYGWAFFLCSMFLGIGITATTGAPMGVLGGMGVGFLFFVDPIYDKVMNKIENL